MLDITYSRHHLQAPVAARQLPGGGDRAAENGLRAPGPIFSYHKMKFNCKETYTEQTDTRSWFTMARTRWDGPALPLSSKALTTSTPTLTPGP